MKIIIFGGTGFIGKNFLEQLNKDYLILAPSHYEVNLLNEDRVKTYLKKHRADVIINCTLVGGKRTEKNPKEMFYQNLKIFFNLIKSKPHFKKIIHFGSGLEYARDRDIKKVKEEDFDKKIPNDERGFYKYICSKIIEKSDNILNLRIFGLYGKYEDYKLRFISNAICRSILGLPITINQDVYFDYVYIDDFVKIVDYFIQNDAQYKFYNIGTGKPINLLTIAQKINKIGNNRSEIIINNKGLNYEYTCDNSRLFKELKNFKFTNFDKTIKDLSIWYKSRRDKIDINSL